MYKLLIVDDNDIQIQSLLNYIDWEEYGISEIRTAQDGAEGLSVFKEFIPDMIITDVVMPKMNGIEMAREIHKLSYTPKFIFISCYEDFDYLKEAIDNEAISYVLKPIEHEVLEESVRKLIHKLEYEKEHDNMSKLLNESMEIYRKNFLYRLLYSKSIDVDYLKSTIQNLNFISYKFFLIAKLEIKNGKGRYIDIYNLINLTEKNLFKKPESTVVVENESRLVVLFMGDQTEKDEFLNFVIKQLNRYSDLVKKGYGINLNIGLSHVHNTLYNPHVMIAQSSCALENNLSFSDDGIYMYDNFELMQTEYNISDLKDSLNRLINKNTQQQLDLFINTYCPENIYSNRYTIKTLSVCIFTVLQILLIERNLDTKDLFGGIAKIWNELNTFETINDFRKWLLNVLKSVSEFINISEQEGHDKLIFEITEYVNRNYTNITNVAQITSNFYISESYARKIFKQYTGKTIFEILLNKRMEEAKKLLSDPNMKTYEVAEMVGYKSKQCFIESFRRYTGYLPKEFLHELSGKDKKQDDKME